MKLSHFLVKTGGLAVLGVSLYAAFTFWDFQNDATKISAGSAADRGNQDAYESTELSDLQNEVRALRQQVEKSINPTVKPGNENARELATLKQDILNLRAELAALRRQVDSGDSSVSDGSARVIDREALTQQQEQQDFERKQAIETSFHKEHTDTNWSTATVDLINQVLMNDELKRTQVVDMTCRSTLCRLEIVHPDQEAASEFESSLPLQVGAALPEISYHHQMLSDGSISTVLYMARTGHSLPAAN